MKRVWLALITFGLTVAAAPADVAPADLAPAWSSQNLMALERWVAMAPLDALPEPSSAALDKALAGGDQAAIDKAASELALKLARMYLLGAASAGERKGWNIEDSDKAIDVEGLLRGSLPLGTLDAFYASLLPRNPEYVALRTAYSSETDPAKRAAVARNMERWRWMPRSLGDEYVLVNAAAFEAQLWRDGREAGTWKVIVGKTRTPTPVFNAQITGVIFNPWWEVPASIVRESVGRLVRRSPATARARGYVWGGGRYRQRPGANNALGQMKLVMPNRFTVYMHDTPNKELFDKEVRAFSHGCIRTGDAIGYAATLLEGVKSRADIDAIVAGGQTTTIDLARPVPVYVAYFTARSEPNGEVLVLPDIYRRDPRIAVAAAPAN